MQHIITIPAMGDNYIYLYRYDGGRAFVIDPGDASAVLEVLEREHLQLTHILLTHTHSDHTAGVKKLKSKTNATVYSPDASAIPETDRQVGDNNTIALPGVPTVVISTPGHTSTAVCYYMPAGLHQDEPALFTGDTLFIGGCGRIIGATAEDFFESMQKLKSLPDETRVYPGHDYTIENYEFALELLPDSKLHKDRLQQLKDLSQNGQPLVPSTIGREKQENLFMRADSPQEFAELRKRKDIFG